MKKLGAFDFGTVIVAYLGLAFISMVWDKLSQDYFFASWKFSNWPSLTGLLSIIVILFLYLLVSELTARLSAWGRQLQIMLKKLLTPISYFQILIIALLSGFIEEWFFRGVLLSHFGVVLSSVFFGLCHLILLRKIWIWSLWAFVFGLVFAELKVWSNSLVLVATLHFLINLGSLIILNLSAYGKPSLWSEAES